MSQDESKGTVLFDSFFPKRCFYNCIYMIDLLYWAACEVIAGNKNAGIIDTVAVSAGQRCENEVFGQGWIRRIFLKKWS